MEEQEIDLRDYLRVLKKRWRLVVGITIGCAVISAVYSLLLPKVYQAAALIEPAKIQKTPIETAATLELLYKNPLNPYLKKIVKEMNLKEWQGYGLVNDFEIKDKAGFLQIVGRAKAPEESKKLVDVICSLILKRHSELMLDALKIASEETDNIRNQMSSVKSEMEHLNKKVLQKEKTEILAQSYVFQGLLTAKEDASKRLLGLEERLRQKEMELKYYTKPAEIIADATLPEFPVAPNKTKIVLIATIVGFMFSIFLVFVVEYFQKNQL